jgi:hypothetical protein
LQNTSTANTSYASYAVNDGGHTAYGELGINNANYSYSAAGFPNNGFSTPLASFVESYGGPLVIGSWDNQKISMIINGAVSTTDAMTINTNGSVAFNGQVGTVGQVLQSNATSAPTWVTPTAGTVTSVTGTSPVASSGGATPAISLSAAYGDTLNPYASKTAKYVLAAPNGADGVPTFRAIVASDIPTLNQNTTGSAGTLTTPRAIYGNNFDGSAALTQIIASTYGGTGNGFAKLSGPATTEKTFTLPNASATILTDNAAVTVLQGGTGSTTASGARTNLGAAASGANSDITSVALTTGTISTAPSASTDIVNKTYADGLAAKWG